MDESKLKITAVYGGTFDPPTLGHYHVIRKAFNLFDKVVVIVASNSSKAPMFSLNERVAMIKDMLSHISESQLEVDALPNHEYLVNYALTKHNARFLIRGIRDNLDFPYEQNICRTNKKICPSVDTIYLMPDDSYSLISSSWVKSLVGCNGWRNVIADSVSPFVLNVLKKRHLHTLVNKITSDLKIHPIWAERVWEEMVKGYSSNQYHNFDHLLNGLESFKRFYPQAVPAMLYAWLMHDVDPSEDKSIILALSHMPFDCFDRDEVKRCIEASKHHTDKYTSDNESVFASIDLLCFAGTKEEYAAYKEKVFMEYFQRSNLPLEEFKFIWQKGRIAFLEKMIFARDNIYPWKPIRDLYEETARANINAELEELKKGAK